MRSRDGRRLCVLLAVTVVLGAQAGAAGRTNDPACMLPAGVSARPAPCAWSRERTITVRLEPARFGPSVDAFSYVVDGFSGTAPDRVADPIGGHGVFSVRVAEGSRYLHVRARSAGVWGEPRHAGPFRIDATGPARPRLTSPEVRRFHQGSSIRLRWEVTDGSSGVARSTVFVRRSRTRDVASTEPKVMTPSGHAVTVPLEPGYHYLISIRARDRAGNNGAVTSISTSTPFATVDRKHGGGWRRVREPETYGGMYAYAVVRGAQLWSQVEGRTLAAVVTKCPGCGALDAYLGKRYLGRLDLTAPTVQRSRVVELLRSRGVVRGRLRLVTLSAKPAIIEGLGASLVRASPRDRAPHVRRVTYPGTFDTGSRARKHIALTFDDGGNDRQVREILAALKRGNARATFFLVGQWVRQMPRAARAIEAAGHQIANHTYSHVNLATNPGALADQIRRTEAAFARAGVTSTPVFRFPYGATNATLTRRANAMGFSVAGWDLDPQGWDTRDPRAVARHVLRNAKGGSVVVMHVHSRADIRALPAIITGLRRKGFSFVTLEEMFSRAG